jgi:hypothetical protein
MILHSWKSVTHIQFVWLYKFREVVDMDLSKLLSLILTVVLIIWNVLMIIEKIKDK